MASALYTIITNHGFGHASRCLAVLAELRRRAPDLRMILNTTVPPWFIRSMLGDAEICLRSVPLDTGIRQQDFLRMDLPGTLDELRELYDPRSRRTRALLENERDWLRSEGVGLILADIPPLAADLGALSGVPCWMLGNFGWDFIYEYYETQVPGFGAIARRIRESYAKCALAFQPPFSADLSASGFRRVVPVGLTGPVPRLSRQAVLRRLRLPDPLPCPLVLLSFGGLGLQNIPYERLAEFDGQRRPARLFLTFDREAPALPNLTRVTDPALRQVDLLQVVERVVSKPGHGTFCEVARTGTPFVCLNRDNFPETPFMLEALRDHFTHHVLSLSRFFDGDWSFITDSLSPPRRGAVERTDGNERIAAEILRYFASE